jgi:AraC family transcriptional regulator
VDLVPEGAVQLSSIACHWTDEIIAEVLSIPESDVPEHRTVSYRLLVNLGPPTPYAWRDEGQRRETVFSPKAVAFLPHSTLNRPHCGPFEFATFSIAPSLVARLIDQDPVDPEASFIQRRNVFDPVAYMLTRQIIAELASPTERLYGETLCVTLAVHLLNAYRRDGAHVPRIKGRLSAARARRVLEFMRANLGAPISMASLAEQAAVSEAHFARAFRATFGDPPHRLLLRWRLQWAQRLMEKDGLAIAEAAMVAGFCDQAHLTNAMRKHFGTTPGDRTRAKGFQLLSVRPRNIQMTRRGQL